MSAGQVLIGASAPTFAHVKVSWRFMQQQPQAVIVSHCEPPHTGFSAAVPQTGSVLYSARQGYLNMGINRSTCWAAVAQHTTASGNEGKKTFYELQMQLDDFYLLCLNLPSQQLPYSVKHCRLWYNIILICQQPWCSLWLFGFRPLTLCNYSAVHLRQHFLKWT